jgi:hypothetical protein
MASGSFYLAARRPTAPWNAWLSRAAPFATGLAIYLDEGGAGGSTALLDLTPGSVAGPPDFGDGALQPGQTFTDALSGVSVTVVAADAAGATVDVVVPDRSTRYAAAASSDGYGGLVAGASVTGVGTYAGSSLVTLTEVPPPGYAPFYWMDGAWHTVGLIGPYTFTLDDDTLIYATFKASPPANDAFAAAQAVTLPSQATAYTKSATTEAGEPSGYTCGPSVVFASCTVWYRLVPATSGQVTIDTAGSDYLASLGVFTGSALGSLTPVTGACNLATVGTQSASVSFAATAGTTYWVQAGAAGVGQSLVVNFAAGP